MSEPKLIQLRSGQFLIGKCNAGDDGSITLDNPFEIVVEPVAAPNGQVAPRAGMFPYAMMSKERKFTFSADQVQMGPVDADDSCTKSYVQATSNIQIATPEQGQLLQG